MKTNVVIRPLSQETLEAAIRLNHEVFKEDVEHDHPPGEGFRASLDLELRKKHSIKHPGVDTLNYFVLIDTDTNIVIGTTGLYTQKNEPDIVWLGWFCLDTAYRGEGLGEYLLTWTINKAKEQGYSMLRLYTSTDPNEAVAQKLYEKLGFKIIGEEKKEGERFKTLYRERSLND